MPRSERIVAGLIVTLMATGCSQQPAQAPSVVAPPTNVSDGEKSAPVVETPAPMPRGAEFLQQAAAALSDGQLVAARSALDELRGSDKLSEDEQAQLAELDAKLAGMIDAENAAAREAALARIPELMATGAFDEAVIAAETAAARHPNDEQREQLAKYREEIERIRGAQRKLGAWMKLVGSKDRAEFRAAQNQLLEEPEAAAPLLIAALREPGEKQRTVNILETLRQLRRPQVILPAIVSLLERPDQQESWPEVIATLGRISEEGAGPLLLKTLSGSTEPAQRTAVLTALSQVSDPPAETLLAMLPNLFQDNAELPTALMCIAASVRRHDQSDLTALRGMGAEITVEQAQQLAALPSRLEALRAAPEPETARAARLASVSLGLIVPEPLAGLEVVSVSGEYPDSPGKAVLDGVWNSNDLKTMWYHPVELDSQIVLDLGAEKTVTGVILWNFNQASGGYRGWKRAEIFVSPTPTALTPVTSGIVPMAPGVNEPADYGVLITVPCVTGRYLKLKAADIWNRNAYTGLSEIQVLGF